MLKGRRCWWLIAAAVGAWCAGCGDDSDVVVLKLGHCLDTTHPVHTGMAFMAKRVAEESGGTMRIDIYPSSQLGSEKECIEQVQLGILAMTKTSSGPLEGFIPKMKVLGLPYLFRDSEHMWKVFNGEIGRQLLDAGVDKDIKGVCYYDAGARSFYSKKPIRTPDDLKGMKIRVLQSIMCQDMIEAMGGTPTPISWGELYTALDQGVVDGAENNPPSFDTSNHYQICKYYTLDEHLRLPDVLIMNPDIWDGLSADQQRILTEAAAESVDYQRGLWAKKEQESLDKVRKAGVEISRPDQALFRQASKRVWDEVEPEIQELARQIQAVE